MAHCHTIAQLQIILYHNVVPTLANVVIAHKWLRHCRIQNEGFSRRYSSRRHENVSTMSNPRYKNCTRQF